MPRFFINRPVFAWVIAILVMLVGLLSIKTLPVAQYPAIAPPQIAINATYPGASAQTVQDTVTQVVEQKLNGIDNLIYMASTSDSAGAVSILLTFKAGTDPNIAQVQVQNKLQLAVPLLPQIVQQQGISVVKSGRNYHSGCRPGFGRRLHGPQQSDRLHGLQHSGYHQPPGRSWRNYGVRHPERHEDLGGPRQTE